MKIVYFGSASFGIPSLEAIAKPAGTRWRGCLRSRRGPRGVIADPKPTDVALWCAATRHFLC
jgi:hypothetical protein